MINHRYYAVLQGSHGGYTEFLRWQLFPFLQEQSLAKKIDAAQMLVRFSFPYIRLLA